MKSVIGAWSTALFCLLLAGSAQAASPPTLSPAIAAQYVHPHDRIDIGHGRKLNLFCMGSGSRTVLFDSGLSDWSFIWALVQPGVAAHARACTYDRAGLGYSDPTDEEHSPISIAQDLQQLIRAAKITTPVVLVGHSLGGFNMKLYAALYPRDVAGLVLVDPSEERFFPRTRAAMRAKFGATVAGELELMHAAGSPGVVQSIARFNACAAATRDHDLSPKSPLYKTCTSSTWPQLGPAIAAETQKMQARHSYQEAQALELAGSVIASTGSDEAYAALFTGHALGNTPLIVLTAGSYNSKDASEAAEFFARNMTHDQTAALSSRGVNRVIADTHHNIEIDRPHVIIDAIDEMLRKAAK